jgi:hypothetical protein
MTRLDALAGDHGCVRSTNWMWVLGVLVVWVGMFFAFLLIAISRP